MASSVLRLRRWFALIAILMIATVAVLPLLVIFTKPSRDVAGDHMQAME